MNQIVTIVLPVFGLIGVGYAVAWARVLPEGSDRALADFCFVIALPLLIFRVLATADFSGGSPVNVWLAYYVGFAIVWTVGTLAVRRLFGRDARTGVVAGVSSAFPNMLLLAMPLVIVAYGDEGAAALAVLITINLPVMMAVSAILNERALVVDGVSTHANARAALRAACHRAGHQPDHHRHRRRHRLAPRSACRSAGRPARWSAGWRASPARWRCSPSA